MFMINRSKDGSLTSKVDFGDILKLAGCKLFTRKFLKLKWTHVSFPTASGLYKS